MSIQCNDFLSKEQQESKDQHHKAAPIRLKGVTLPTFSGEEKSDYESWKAAFMSVVDRLDVPVEEKMLRLQSCLSGKALAMVKDLGYSNNAYERAKSKLEKRYGGERRLHIKHLTALRNFRQVQPQNLEDLKELQTLLEKVLIAIQDHGPIHGQSLCLTAKEKLPEEYVQAYKCWLRDHSCEDNFEIRVQVMEEDHEETKGIGKKEERGANFKKRQRGYATSSATRNCIVPNCKEDHPPWICKAFKDLPVIKRKELIAKSGRCYRCLAAGHRSKDCTRSRPCGVGSCPSREHSSYLHLANPKKRDSGEQLPPNTPTYVSPGQSAQNKDPPPSTTTENRTLPPTNQQLQERTHATTKVENVSLMVIPALIGNGRREIKVNVMLDPCSTSSYVSEDAAHELGLHGQTLNLTIAGTGGIEIQKRSRHVELNVTSLDRSFTAPVQAHVLDNIAGDTPAIQWCELRKKWPHLQDVPFDPVSKRQQIDVYAW